MNKIQFNAANTPLRVSFGFNWRIKYYDHMHNNIEIKYTFVLRVIDD